LNLLAAILSTMVMYQYLLLEFGFNPFTVFFTLLWLPILLFMDVSLFVDTKGIYSPLFRIGLIVALSLGPLKKGYVHKAYGRDLEYRISQKRIALQDSLYAPLTGLEARADSLKVIWAQRKNELMEEKRRLEALRDAELNGFSYSDDQSGTLATGKEGKGSRFNLYQNQVQSIAHQLDQLKKQQSQLESETAARKSTLQASISRRQDLVESDPTLLELDDDMEALKNDPKHGKSVNSNALSLSIFALLVEMIGLIIKFMIGKTSYHVATDEEEKLTNTQTYYHRDSVLAEMEVLAAQIKEAQEKRDLETLRRLRQELHELSSSIQQP